MLDWWANISTFEKFFWFFAIPFSFVFLIQLVLMIFGLGDHDMVGDGHGDVVTDTTGGHDAVGTETGSTIPFHLFTIRNFIIFFTVFGWAGIAATNAGLSRTWTTIVAFVSGFVVMMLLAGVFYMMTRMSESGNISLANAVGHVATVYLPIPGQRSGVGRIQMTLQDSIREVDAMTEGEALATGTLVRVSRVLSEDRVLVEKSE